eukprot:12656415-Alexandrium_andersonii.AAC.1
MTEGGGRVVGPSSEVAPLAPTGGARRVVAVSRRSKVDPSRSGSPPGEAARAGGAGRVVRRG